MLVKELDLTEPVVCLIDDYLQKSALLLSENNIVYLPVVESFAHRNVIGFVTDREICRQAIAKGLDPKKTTVGRVMNNRFFTVTPDTRTDECWRIMKENKVDFLFVNKDDNSCSGILTKDLLPEKEFFFDSSRLQIQYAKTDRLF